MDRRLPPALVVYLKGFCMGAADAVPGVSGGTIALITGIYERLIAAVTAVGIGRLLDLLAGVAAADPQRLRDAVDEMDGWFLLALGVGIVTAVVTVTRVLDAAIEEIPVLTFGFFFGLIAASAWALSDEVVLDTPGRIGAAITGFVLAFVVSGRAAAALSNGPVVVFVAGAVAVSAMILPGISGSLLLIILGQYEFMVGSLSAFVDALVGGATGGGAVFGDAAAVVVTFVSGAVVGLFTVAHVVRRALERYREATLAFLVSLIVGALRAPVVKTGETLAESGRGWTPEVVGIFLAAAVVGAVAVLAVDRLSGGIEY